MLEQHPIWRERLIAFMTFALIFFAGAVGMDFLLTNGLQWGADPSPPAAFTSTLRTEQPTRALPTQYLTATDAETSDELEDTIGLADEPLAGDRPQTDTASLTASYEEAYASAYPFDVVGAEAEDAVEAESKKAMLPADDTASPW